MAIVSPCWHHCERNYSVVFSNVCRVGTGKLVCTERKSIQTECIATVSSKFATEISKNLAKTRKKVCNNRVSVITEFVVIKSYCTSLNSAPPRWWIQAPSNIIPWASMSPEPKWHRERCSHFACRGGSMGGG